MSNNGVAAWVELEMATLDLGHGARNSRFKRVLSDLSAMPSASFTGAVGGGRAELEAIYRLFDNAAVHFDDMLKPHYECSLDRIRQQRSVILVQDTTEIELTRPKQQVVGAGPLDDGPRRGCFVHPLMAFAPGGVPLGSLDVFVWTREEPTETKLGSAEKAKQKKNRPIEEKESHRWVRTLEKAQAVAAQVPDTEVIVVADSEADIYEFLALAQSTPGTRWIVRGCQDRALKRGNDDSEDVAGTIFAAVEQAEVVGTIAVHVRGRDTKVACDTRGRRQARESRATTIAVRACPAVLRAPQRSGRKLPDVKIHVVLARELNPPEGEEPVEWLLLTNLPIDTPEQILRVAETYPGRWMIEVFFRVLKQGCKVESRRFETLDRVQRFLGVAMIIAWRTLLVTRLGRACPDVDCEAFFEPSEWKAVYQVTQKRTPPKTPPKLQEMVRMVAQLGGYVNRPRADEPGTDTIWKGLQRMHDMASCWDLFGPGQQER